MLDLTTVSQSLPSERSGWVCVVAIYTHAQFCPAFVNILNEMRKGSLSTQAIRTFASLRRPIKYADGLGKASAGFHFVHEYSLCSAAEPTCLYPTRDEVAQQNYERLGSLKGHEMCYTSEDTSGRDIDGKWYFPDPEKLLDVLNKAGSLTRSLTTT